MARPTITSVANDKVKYVRTLERRRMREKEGRFVAEGARVLEDALRAGSVPALVFYAPELEATPRGKALLKQLSLATAEVYPVSEAVMAAVSDTVTPQGVLAVLSMAELRPRSDSLWLILDGIQDPGNLGTLLRSAEAAGVGQVWLAPGTADAFSAKVVRAGAGVHFRLPLTRRSWPEITHALQGRPVRLAEEGSELAYDDADWTQPTALIVSNEGGGPSGEAREAATERIAIPMQGGTESLNVGVAASVILFEAARQRRNRTKTPDVSNTSEV
jgi:RNA methyltransferase, TrmH family